MGSNRLRLEGVHQQTLAAAPGSAPTVGVHGQSPPGDEQEPAGACAGIAPWHDHFRSLIRLQRRTERFDTRPKGWQMAEETAYYLCELALSAAGSTTLFAGRHWEVESRTYYVRDTRFQEDASRIRRNPCIFALLCSFALNLMRFNGVDNISQALYDNALCLDRVLAYEGL
ncbi:MAG: hypothetical protein J5I81_00600 [Nitrococcus mobilis]|nr:hypothetical protein [Nitrococcus mobilis]